MTTFNRRTVRAWAIWGSYLLAWGALTLLSISALVERYRLVYDGVDTTATVTEIFPQTGCVKYTFTVPGTPGSFRFAGAFGFSGLVPTNFCGPTEISADMKTIAVRYVPANPWINYPKASARATRFIGPIFFLVLSAPVAFLFKGVMADEGIEIA